MRRRILNASRGCCALGVVAALGAWGPAGCKRRDTLPPVTFTPLDESGEGAAVSDAPVWPVPARALLDNQTLVYWQHEPDAAGFHVRLLLPAVDGDGLPLRAAEVLAMARLFEVRLESGLERHGVDVAVAFAPGRFEVGLVGPTRSLDRSMRWLANVLATAPTDRQRSLARGRAVKAFRVPAHADVAAVDVVARLLGLAPQTQLGSRAELLASEWRVGWRDVVDPRRAVVVVHAGAAASAESSIAMLGAFAGKWTASWGGDDGKPTAVARLRAERATSHESVRGRLVGTPRARLHVVEPDLDVAGGRPTLVLGRLVPTPTPADRAMARLAQRVAQEAIDARLEFSGDVAVLLVRVPLLQRDVTAGVSRTLRDLTNMAETEQTRGRLSQATRLWLGARLVGQSLAGEDWTALWSESLDLALDDAEITRALAHEAEHMMAITPEQLQAWMQQWLHPENSEEGWAWSVTGLDQPGREALAEGIELDVSRWAG